MQARTATSPRSGTAASPEARGPGWWLAAATLVLPSLVVVPLALDAFRLPQRMAAEWLALASLLGCAGVLARVRGRALLAQPSVQAALPLLLVALCGLFWTAHPAHVRDGVVDLAIGVAALVCWSLAFAPAALRRLLEAAMIPAVALAVLAILQLHHWWEPVQTRPDLGGARMGLTAFAGNPGDLAALLVLPCLVAQARLGAADRRATPWGWALALALGVYALAASQTLTALAALLAGSVVLWAVRLPRRALWGGAAGLLVAALVLLAVPALRARAAFVAHAGSTGQLNEMLSGRLDGWRVAVELLREHPFAGVGQGAYRAEFAPAKLRLLAEGTPFYVGHVNPSFANAHDEYLEIAADLGWPGVLALLWGIGVLVVAGWRARRALEAGERGLVLAGLVALALLALTYFPLRLAPVALGWTAFLAWVAANGGAAADRDDAASDERRARARRIACTVLLALVLAGQTVRGASRLLSSMYVHAVQQQMGAANATGRVPSALVDASLRVLARAHRLDPAAVEPLAFAGDVLLVAHRDPEADAAYRRAIAHEPRGETFFNHGLLLWQMENSDGAVVELRRGVALLPRLTSQVPPGAAAEVASAPIVPLPR